MAVGGAESYVTSTMGRPGDVLICTKGAAIEATALFGVTFPDALHARIGADLTGRAARLFEQMSVVEEARIAVAYGVRDQGVTSLHDATEGGVIGGIFEIARASGVGVRFDEQAVPIRPEVAAVCGAVGIDPLTAISEGTLLMTVRPEHAQGVLLRLREAGIEASAIGEIVTADRGMVRLSSQGERTLEHPQVDPFWAAFGRALEAGL
jgi:hydrogenase maturation factor